MKIPVGIVGATGGVGQKFVQLLSNHPYFRIAALAASGKSSGKTYGEAVHWVLPTQLPPEIAVMPVSSCEPDLPCRVVFSALDSSVAGEIESRFAAADYTVISNSKNHRWDSDVPLLIPEVNPGHLHLLDSPDHPGAIVTNPNCSATGLVLALKPLVDQFGIREVHVVTLQALSGAGYPGVSGMDVLDNVLPWIDGEEEKLEREPLKILGSLQGGVVKNLPLRISAQCNRVPVLDGHLECVSVRLEGMATAEEIIEAWRGFTGEPQALSLPMAPERPIHYLDHPSWPQPRLHRDLDKGMAVSIGRLRPCSIFPQHGARRRRRSDPERRTDGEKTVPQAGAIEGFLLPDNR